MAKFGFGQTVSRKEDDRLLRGAGAYTDDAALPGQAHGIVLRSPHAHARIDRLDAARARAAPGVLAILTAAEAQADGLGTQPCFAPTTNLDGSPYVSPPHPLLAQDTVRHVGDPVAFVVAETRERAREAADLVDIDDAVLAAAADTAAALSIAQGAGQAPMELAACDPSGRLVTGSFMDDAMPRAADLPMFAVRCNEIPRTTDALGIRGAGEAGSAAAPPAIVNGT